MIKARLLAASRFSRWSRQHAPAAVGPPRRALRRPRHPSRQRSRSGSAPAAGAGCAGSYKIGYSNAGGVGNGFREEQVCTAKAEALASGQVVRADHGSTATPTPPASCGHP